MIILIDNFDSFTYNLYHLLLSVNPSLPIRVYRNNEIDIPTIVNHNPQLIAISPGPATPEQAGISLDIVKQLHDKIPIFGVCLGMQTIAAAFQGEIVRAQQPMHGKIDNIYHQNTNIFRNIPAPFQATRYHSLIVKRDTLPDCLEILAETNTKEVMSIKHRNYPILGVQFHPESIKTEYGNRLIKGMYELWNLI